MSIQEMPITADIQPMTSSRVSVIGGGRSGQSVARLLHARGMHVFVSDSAPLTDGAKSVFSKLDIDFEEDGHTERLAQADLVVVSPGVSDSSPPMIQLLENGIPCYSELEVASWYCPADVAAITGSNGKTTTTLLLGDIMKRSGRKTWIAGNIGIPFSDVVLKSQKGDLIVLEVSSFQLDHTAEFHPNIAVMLNITPDHLDRYSQSMSLYAGSKARIFKNQGPEDTLIYNMDDERIVSGLPSVDEDDGPRLMGFSINNSIGAAGFFRDDMLYLNTEQTNEVLMQKNELSLTGRHNASNALAAAIAARVMEVGSGDVRNSLATFEGVPHRLEFIREVDGVEYVNDSKATNVNAVWYALESYSQPVILIAGGRDKGNDYASLVELVQNRVRVLISIGEAGSKLDTELGPYVDQRVRAESLSDAVRYASLLSRSGEVVLLSPACSSFDMFESFEHRGDVFRHLVANL